MEATAHDSTLAHGCVFPLHGFLVEACVSLRVHVCLFLVLFCYTPGCVRGSCVHTRCYGGERERPTATSTVAIRFSDK